MPLEISKAALIMYLNLVLQAQEQVIVPTTTRFFGAEIFNILFTPIVIFQLVC